MAELKVFGMPGCVRCQDVKQYLANAGQSVRVGDRKDLKGFEAAIIKALASHPASELFSVEKSAFDSQVESSLQTDSIAISLNHRPELLLAPLVVRGHQVVVANRQDQAGALRY